MDTRDSDELPARLEATRRRFEQWRRTRQGRARIPDTLWAAAVKMASSYGVAQTARVLRLDYYGLKKRLEQEAAASAGSDSNTVTTFLELAVPERRGSAECVLELDSQGVKKRVHLKGLETPALAGLIRSFWDS